MYNECSTSDSEGIKEQRNGSQRRSGFTAPAAAPESLTAVKASWSSSPVHSSPYKCLYLMQNLQDSGFDVL